MYDGFLGYINDNDPIPSDVRECIDRFLLLPKEEQNLYFMMYDNKLDYTEKKDEFGKVIPYSLSDWIKTALSYIKGFNSQDCTNYALGKSVANIESFKILDKDKKEEKDGTIKFITNTADRVPIFTDEEHNRTVYSDGSIIDNTTGKEIPTSEFANKVKEINDSIEDKPEYNKKDKEDFDHMKRKADNEYPKNMKYKKKIYDGCDQIITELIESAEQEERFLLEHKDNIWVDDEEESTASEVSADNASYKLDNSNSYDEDSDHITPYEFFMGVANLAAKRSKDPNTKVGACIVKNGKIISTGYNGMPYVKDGDNDKIYNWNRTGEDETDNKYFYVVHAELNAILNTTSDVEGCTLFCTLSPCNECAKAIIQSKIAMVVYRKTRDEKMFNKALVMLKNAGIIVKKF